MIDRVELAQYAMPDLVLAVTFYYDSYCKDTFTVFNPRHAGEIMRFVETEPDPEAVLIMIRDLSALTVH